MTNIKIPINLASPLLFLGGLILVAHTPAPANAVQAVQVEVPNPDGNGNPRNFIYTVSQNALGGFFLKPNLPAPPRDLILEGEIEFTYKQNNATGGEQTGVFRPTTTFIFGGPNLTSPDGVNADTQILRITEGGTNTLGYRNRVGNMEVESIPGPLPILGVGMAYSYARRLRKVLSAR